MQGWERAINNRCSKQPLCSKQESHRNEGALDIPQQDKGLEHQLPSSKKKKHTQWVSATIGIWIRLF